GGVNCTIHSTCEDGDGAKAAVCGCEDGYVFNGMECTRKCRMIGSKCVSIQMSRVNWWEARRRCQKLGGDLLELPEQTDLDEFVAYIPRHFDVVPGSVIFWVGAQTTDVGATFKWVPSDTLILPTFWLTGEQNNQPSFIYSDSVNGESCVAFYKTSTDPFFWNDIYCGGDKFFACEIPE
ncbi:unnamed protein product, partial [Meganyctiphanes norvegica]